MNQFLLHCPSLIFREFLNCLCNIHLSHCFSRGLMLIIFWKSFVYVCATPGLTYTGFQVNHTLCTDLKRTVYNQPRVSISPPLSSFSLSHRRLFLSLEFSSLTRKEFRKAVFFLPLEPAPCRSLLLGAFHPLRIQQARCWHANPETIYKTSPVDQRERNVSFSHYCGFLPPLPLYISLLASSQASFKSLFI